MIGFSNAERDCQPYRGVVDDDECLPTDVDAEAVDDQMTYLHKGCFGKVIEVLPLRSMNVWLSQELWHGLKNMSQLEYQRRGAL